MIQFNVLQEIQFLQIFTIIYKIAKINVDESSLNIRM